jgi:hypothetical protein
MRYLLGDGCGGLRVVGHVCGEFVGEWWEESAGSLPGFVKLASAEMAHRQQGEDVSFDEGAERFEEVEGEAVAVSDVGVDDAESGVESNGEDGESGFGRRGRSCS